MKAMSELFRAEALAARRENVGKLRAASRDDKWLAIAGVALCLLAAVLVARSSTITHPSQVATFDACPGEEAGLTSSCAYALVRADVDWSEGDAVVLVGHDEQPLVSGRVETVDVARWDVPEALAKASSRVSPHRLVRFRVAPSYWTGEQLAAYPAATPLHRAP